MRSGSRGDVCRRRVCPQAVGWPLGLPGLAAGVPADQDVGRDEQRDPRQEGVVRLTVDPQLADRLCPGRRSGTRPGAPRPVCPQTGPSVSSPLVEERDPRPGDRPARRRAGCTVSRSASSASSLRLRTRSSASSARGAHSSRSSPSKLAHDVAQVVRDRHGPPLVQVDEHERLRGGRHQLAVWQAMGRALVRDAGAADAAHADESLEQVVEAGRCVVLDVRGAHHELGFGDAHRRAEVAVVLGARVVEVRAGSGRSRRHPARRCPRTRRGSAPST